MKQHLRELVLMVFVFSLVALGISSVAHATPILKMSDGTTTVEIVDGGALDTNPLGGAISYSGPVGNFFATNNITVAITKPLLGSAISPFLDIAAFNSTQFGAGGGTLTIMFTDTGFTAPAPLSLIAEVGGTTHGSVRFETFLDQGNLAFGTGIPLTDTGVLTSNPFTGTDIATLGTPLAVPYSLSLQLNITHTAVDQNTSYDASLRLLPQPEPSTLLLLSSGLAGLMFVGRRRMTRMTNG